MFTCPNGMQNHTLARIGKTADITKADLEGRLVGQQEDESLEAKLVPSNRTKLVMDQLPDEDRQLVIRWDVQELIVSAAVGLLNKEDGSGGLVVLGCRAPRKTIVGFEPIPDAELGRLESAVLTKISATSPPFAPQIISIVRVPFELGRSVSLVEAVPVDRNVLYYSSSSSHAYRREGDSTRRLSLAESLRLSESKRVAKVFVNVLNVRLDITATGKDLVASLRFLNLGNTPGRYVSSLLLFRGGFDELKLSLKGQGISDVTQGNPGWKKALDVVGGYPPNSKLIYPRLGSMFGELRVADIADGSEIEVQVQTYEDRGATEQRFTLSRKGEAPDMTEGPVRFVQY